ncbi:MAG: hypothetical protein M3N53_01185 [Actinomycetota bacterium]|nr:hypothetical protein [Actinomycetota bacterium]
MSSSPSRRLVALLPLVALVLAVPGGQWSHAQTTSSCRDPEEETPEDYGPTDISAVSGNQQMSVAVNEDATVTVLKWPTPSYYDQIKYRTTDRAEPRLGALPNEGSLIGLGYKKGLRPWRFDWLRSWPSTQRFADDDGDEVITSFRNRTQGLQVVVRDVVAHDQDAFVRSVNVRRTAESPVTRARVIAFANFNPVFSKTPRSPTQDWCTEEDNDSGGTYLEGPDAIVHTRVGADESTGQPSGASLVLAFDRESSGHAVGADTYASGSGEGSAYDDARDARLSDSEIATGQADAALADDISLASKRSGSSTIYIAAGFSQEEAISNLDQARSRSVREIRRAKATWWRRWLSGAKVPRDAPRSVLRLAKRSLISLRQAADPRGLIVASIATQAPQGLDWIRNGAYINEMLHVAGHPEMVARHNVRYAELQATSVRKPIGGEATPPGNWSQNYYTDGVVGGPISYEIDETGLGIWTLWDHYAHSKDRDYLLSVYEAIQRAAHYLSDNPPLGCRDPATGLQCTANEGDNPQPTRTLVGAQAVWLGLDSAVKAARALGTDTAKTNAEKWAARRDELRAAIEQNFFDKECSCYTRDYEVGGTLLWPVGLETYGSKRSDAQADINWRRMTAAFAGKAERGWRESRGLLGNAYAWQGEPRKLRRVKRGLRWVAEVPTTDETGILGEAWMRYPKPTSKIVTMVSQPHVWNQAMFYLAAVKAYGGERWSP